MMNSFVNTFLSCSTCYRLRSKSCNHQFRLPAVSKIWSIVYQVWNLRSMESGLVTFQRSIWRELSPMKSVLGLEIIEAILQPRAILWDLPWALLLMARSEKTMILISNTKKWSITPTTKSAFWTQISSIKLVSLLR